MKQKEFDYLIIGAGIYGLYIARKLAILKPTYKIAIIEYDSKPFQRASFINQARVHNGYHYPRSLSTALKSAMYYDRFVKDYSFAINKQFEKIYAISKNFTFASAKNFRDFCTAAGIPCNHIHTGSYFKSNLVEAAFITQEFSMDADMIAKYFMTEVESLNNVQVFFNVKIETTENKNGKFHIYTNEIDFVSAYVINSTYASINQILNLFNFDLFDIKYEISEIALCDVSSNILSAGITLMDGPFFSLMPFGLTNSHSLSAVHYTPHKTSYENLPNFACQALNKNCTSNQLENCNHCIAKPHTAWHNMHKLAMKYLKDEIKIEFKKSLFAVKPILKSSEISDSRPTVIKQYSSNPTFISVLSGKFNTMYDLDEILNM